MAAASELKGMEQMAYTDIPIDNTNLAYDLSRFDKSEKEQRAEEALKSRMHLAPAVSVSKSGSKLKVAAAALALFGAFCAVNCSNTRKDDALRLVEQQQTELKSAMDDNALLKSRLDGKVNTAYIEKYAAETLGMVKVSASQKKYISVNTESLVEVGGDEKDGVVDSVKSWFGGIVEYIGL